MDEIKFSGPNKPWLDTEKLNGLEAGSNLVAQPGAQQVSEFSAITFDEPELAASLAHISIINASRSTSLTCFPKHPLSAALAGVPLSSPLDRPQPVLSHPPA